MIVGPGTHPAFTPDGTRLGYAHASGAIALADLRALASGRPSEFPTQMLVTLADLTRISTVSASRGMGVIGGPQFSADGKLVAYAAIEKGPILDAVQIVYTQELAVGAPPKLWVIGKTGAIHHVAELRWSPTAPLLGVLDHQRAATSPLDQRHRPRRWSAPRAIRLGEALPRLHLVAGRRGHPRPGRRRRRVALLPTRPLRSYRSDGARRLAAGLVSLCPARLGRIPPSDAAGRAWC